MSQPDDSTPITMTLSVREWNLLIAGLGKLPLEAAAETWIKVRQEAAGQLDQLAADARQKAQDQMREDIVRG
jgi:hypothetical protein